MELQPLRATLGEEHFAKLETYISDLESQRDAARQESISHRHSLKNRAAELEQENGALKKAQSDLLERLGVDSLESVAELDPKGQAELALQYEAKLKRIERDMQEKAAAYSELEARHKKSLMDAAMQRALAGHEWIDAEMMASYVAQKLVFEDDDVKFRAEDGLLMGLKDGVQSLAKNKPHLVKATGARGSGFQSSRDGEKVTHMARASFESLTPAAKRDFLKSGGQLTME